MTLPGQITIFDAIAALDERPAMNHDDKCQDCGAPMRDGHHIDELEPDVLAAMELLAIAAHEQHRRRQLDHPHDTRAALAAAGTYAKRLPPGDGLTPALIWTYLSYRTGVERATLTEALDEAHALLSLLATFPQALTAIRQETLHGEATAALGRNERRS